MDIKYGAAGFALSLLLASQPALAAMEVLESTVPGIKAGSKLMNGAYLKLPKGSTLRLLVETADGSSATKTLKGPYEGTAAAYREKRSWWRRLTGRNTDPDLPIGASKAFTKPVK